MSVSDLIKERIKKKRPPASDKEAKQHPASTKVIDLDELASRVGPSGLKRLRIENQYEGRRTISASVPAWIKAALDYVALVASKRSHGRYSGFGGKSRFIAEALEAKLKADFPEVYEKLQRSS